MSGKPIIAIDPGHNCAPDTGAEASIKGSTIKEDNISLEVGRKLEAICKSAGIPTVWCLPTSANSVQDSLSKRVAAANKSGATIYLSIHCNCATPTELPRGTEAYATSVPGKALAQEILKNLADFGWKNRGVKVNLDGGKPPYVVSNTNAVAVLIEVCFLDSAVDRIILAQVGTQKIAEAIFDAVVQGTNLGSSSSVTNISSTAVKQKTVLDAIKENPGSTSGVDGLSDQIIQRMGASNLIRLSAPNFKAGENCDPFFQPHVHAALVKVLGANPTLTMTCNSGYRSIVRQLVLHENYLRRIGGIGLAARPGKSAHEGGCAVDVNEWQQWKLLLEAQGWDWQGSEDPVHFQMSGSSSTPPACIKAFQQLWNENNPGNPLTTDGVFGDQTRQAMLSAPAAGWIVSKEFNRSLNLGMSGKDVVLLAQQLRSKDFYNQSIEHDRFEQPIKSAVEQYQKAQGLMADGIAGRSTLQELFGDTKSLFTGFLDRSTFK